MKVVAIVEGQCDVESMQGCGSTRSMLARWMVHVLWVWAACASTPYATPTPILVQVLRPGMDQFDESAWSAPLERNPRLRSARLGEVVVSGIWTVYFEFDAADAGWLEALQREHRAYRVTWAGLQLNTDGRSGYILHMNGKVHAEQVLAQPPWSAVRSDAAR